MCTKFSIIRVNTEKSLDIKKLLTMIRKITCPDVKSTHHTVFIRIISIVLYLNFLS